MSGNSPRSYGADYAYESIDARDFWPALSVWLLFALWLLFLFSAGCARPLARALPLVRVEVRDSRVEERATVERAVAGTVVVRVLAAGGTATSGSGAVVTLAGHLYKVLTAQHVIGHGAGEMITIEGADGSTGLAIIEREDEQNDLALLSVVGSYAGPVLRLAPTPPAPYARVFLIGAPENEAGHVGDGRWAGKLDDARAITGGFLWPGMSGGPAVDTSGDIVGVNEKVTISRASPNTLIPQMAYVVDWADVRAFLTIAGIVQANAGVANERP